MMMDKVMDTNWMTLLIDINKKTLGRVDCIVMVDIFQPDTSLWYLQTLRPSGLLLCHVNEMTSVEHCTALLKAILTVKSLIPFPKITFETVALWQQKHVLHSALWSQNNWQPFRKSAAGRVMMKWNAENPHSLGSFDITHWISFLEYAAVLDVAFDFSHIPWLNQIQQLQTKQEAKLLFQVSIPAPSGFCTVFASPSAPKNLHQGLKHLGWNASKKLLWT